jgi:predicted transcriptional regulator
MENEIKETYHKAFYDLLEEQINNEPVNIDWLCKLYSEIREKLCNLIPKKTMLKIEIEEVLDVDLFKQMIKHKVFDGPELLKLINFVFDCILRLQSPQRDTKTNEMRKEVLDILYKNESFGKIVCLLIKNANICIDLIYLDCKNLLEK